MMSADGRMKSEAREIDDFHRQKKAPHIPHVHSSSVIFTDFFCKILAPPRNRDSCRPYFDKSSRLIRTCIYRIIYMAKSLWMRSAPSSAA